jgi:DNA processing protein
MGKIPANQDEVFYQLALSEVENVGVVSVRKLIKHFGTAREVFGQSKRELMQVQGMSLNRAVAISSFNGFDRVQKEFAFAEKTAGTISRWDYSEF